MKFRLAAMATALLLGILVLELQASGQGGVYGVIDRVVVEPANGPADRVQIWGAFAVLEYVNRGFSGYVYTRPTRGYLYFKLPPDAIDYENTRREWKDLASVAGTKQPVSFGYWDRFRGNDMMTIRNAEKPTNPDIYYTDIGVTKLKGTGGIIGELLKLAESR